MTVAGLENLVDRYCKETSVAGVTFCVNVQKALFDSQAWESLYHGYDPEGPADQPLLRSQHSDARSLTPDQRGRYWIHQLWLLQERGVNHFQTWIDRCRHYGVQGWLSMRMNDCHHNDDVDSFWHSSLWKERPDLHRGMGREDDWFETAFDYGHQEVRGHHMALVSELCDRFDFDGLELDWMRWAKHFKPGHEQHGAKLLNEFMREARAHIERASRRNRRKVSLGVRLPTSLSAALKLGYDVYTWSNESLVDQVVLCPFFQQSEYDWPIEEWRAVFGESVRILAQPESIIRPYPSIGASDCFVDYALLNGSAASAHQRGADGIYLFNECYRMSPTDRFSSSNPELITTLLSALSDHDVVKELYRRQTTSYHQVQATGTGLACPLPASLRKPKGSWSFDRHGKILPIRLFLGGKPRSDRVTLELSFNKPVAFSSLQVWSNGNIIDAKSPRTPQEVIRPETAKHTLAYSVSNRCLHDDENVIELLADHSVSHDADLVWAEFIVGAR